MSHNNNLHSLLWSGAALFNPISYLGSNDEDKILEYSSLVIQSSVSIYFIFFIASLFTRMINPVQNKSRTKSSSYISWFCFLAFEIFALPLTYFTLYLSISCNGTSCGVSRALNMITSFCLILSVFGYKSVNYSQRIKSKNSPSR